MKLSEIDISKTMTPAELAALGFARVSRGDAIRAMCLQCMGGSSNEVKACVSGTCPLFVFRLGSDPWRTERVMTDEQREAAIARLAKAREARA